MGERAGGWRTFRVVVSYLIAAGCLFWVFHDIHAGQLLNRVSAINWAWVALGMLFDVFSYVSQGLRWHILLRSVGKVSVLQTTRAVYAGLFLNEVLPMRIGEVARGYLVSRWIPAEFVRVVPSMALERLFEGIWLAVGIGLTALFVPLPANLMRSVDILGIFVLLATALFVFFVLRVRTGFRARRGDKELRWKWLTAARNGFGKLVDGFREIGMTRAFYLGLGISFLLFAFQAFSFWFIMLAYHLHFSFWVGAAVFLIIHFGTSLPNAPANVGTYQFFCVLGLTLFGVDKTTATGFSIVVFILLTLPLLVLGFFAFAQSGLTLSSIREKLNRLGRRR